MSTHGLSAAATKHFTKRMAAHVEHGEVPGLVALIARDDDCHVAVVGSPALDDTTPLGRDALFRIASLSKPITAAAAMALVDDGVLTVGDSVEPYLPELANRQVLRRLTGPLEDTVPAERAITVEDLLTGLLGFGNIIGPPEDYPILHAEIDLNLHTLGPPWPPPPLSTDEWLARFSTLPLMEQPGDVWRYNTGIHLLGMLIERATGERLGSYLQHRLFEPLGMVDTAFFVPPEKAHRLTTAYYPAETGELQLLDPATGGSWNEPQALDNGAGMLVSTIDDFWAFVTCLIDGGRGPNGERVLSEHSVVAMKKDHLSDEQRGPADFFLGSHSSWGYGMAVPFDVGGELPMPYGYGWDGGTGTVWRTDPVRGLTGILFTQRAMTSPQPPPLYDAFWKAAYAAIDG